MVSALANWRRSVGVADDRARGCHRYLIALRAREAGNPEGDGPDPDAVAGLVVISTLLSVISLPLVLGFLVG